MKRRLWILKKLRQWQKSEQYSEAYLRVQKVVFPWVFVSDGDADGGADYLKDKHYVGELGCVWDVGLC